MREPRWIANQRAKESAKQEMRSAYDAVQQFRYDGDASGFPDLRYYLNDFVRRPRPEDKVFKISGWGVRNEPVTREEYDRMKAAWRQTEAGKADKYDLAWETPTSDNVG